MPIYEYRCGVCERRVAVLVRSAAKQPTCPECGSSLTDKLFSTPNLLSGRTRHRPERTCCGQEDGCDSPACSCDDGCRHH